MRIQRRLISKLAVSTMLVVVSGLSARAQDATAVADRFKAIMELQGFEMSWAAISGEAPSFSLDGVRIKPLGQPDALEIGKVSFEGVEEDGSAFTVESISTQPFSKSQDGVTVEISPFQFTGVTLPADGTADPIANLMFYSGAELASVVVRMGDRTVFSMDNLTAEVTPPEDGKPMAFTGSVEKFTADLSGIEDPQARSAIEAMGYQTINGYMELAGTWQPSDGRMGFSQYDISVEDAGTFGMTFDLGGYTPDFIKAMQEMQKKMAEQPADADNSAQGLAMLGLMQQLTFHSASLRWDDDSLTGKAIDYIAKMQNMKPDDIRNQAKAIVPFLTAQLNNPELSSQITAAVTKFLDDPKSLEVAAEPAAPVPFAQIAAAGMSNPLELTKTLAVTVSANEDE
jgi:hypothetical protein